LNIHIKTYEGIGDCLYTRPFIKILAQSNNVYIDTVLPKLFSDIDNVHFIKHDAETYRTQQKELNKDDTVYVNLPKKIDKYYQPQYGSKELTTDSIISTFYKQLQIPFYEKLDWSLPDFSDILDKHNIPTDRKIAIIRPHTIRKEWEVTTRGANPNYIAWCCKILNEAGYYTIAIADLEKNVEVLADNIDVPAQLKLYKGELGIYGTLELIKRADLVVGGSGFIIPACASAQTPLFLILGGRLAFDGISKTLHPSMDLNKIHYAVPDNPCKCMLNKHECDKKISKLDVEFFNFLRIVQNAN
jgi:ADP-heptose:LPS heptosyltransferase